MTAKQSLIACSQIDLLQLLYLLESTWNQVQQFLKIHAHSTDSDNICKMCTSWKLKNARAVINLLWRKRPQREKVVVKKLQNATKLQAPYFHYIRHVQVAKCYHHCSVQRLAVFESSEEAIIPCKLLFTLVLHDAVLLHTVPQCIHTML